MKAFPFPLLILIIGFHACRQQYKDIPLVTEPDYKKGLSFLEVKADSAFYYFNKVTTNSGDSLQIAMAYNCMAGIQADSGDYFGSQESLLMSLKYLDETKERDKYCLLSTYNELGSSSLKLKNYDAAIGYYDLALKLVKDDFTKTIVLNNTALVYHKKHDYARAIAIYRSGIDQLKKDKREYARIVSNLANARWLQNSSHQAAPELWAALQIRREEKDDWGLNASYAHLSDYYSHSHPDSALIYANKMYNTAQQIKSPDDELEALQKLISLSPPQTAKQYFIRYQYLADSIQTSRNAAKNQFALIRYDVEKSKADNLVLQKDNTEKKIQIIWQRVFLYGIIFILLSGAIISVTWYRKRKQQIIHEQRLKTSQKVHDVVANGLYRIMADIEHSETIEKEPLLDKIEVLYEQSRDISYEPPENSYSDFYKVIASLLTTFASPTTKVLMVGNHKDLWYNVKELVKKDLEAILQELMVNMKKHSHAQNVVVKFEQADDYIKIQYTDDGDGLPANFQYGNGLTNTENRIKAIDGRITFDKSIPKGLKIEVLIPIAHIRHD